MRFNMALNIRAKVKILFFLALITSLFNISAAYAVWTGERDVHRVYSSVSSVYVQTVPQSDLINPDGCVSKLNYVLDPSSAMFDKQYQALLTALAAGRKVSLSISGCLGSYPKIRSVIIY